MYPSKKYWSSHMVSINESDEIKDLEARKMMVDSGQAALRALLTMNGGASTVFLGFIGTALSGKIVTFEKALLFVPALEYFIAGVLLTVVAYGTIYLTNVCSAHRHYNYSWISGGTIKNLGNTLGALTIVIGCMAIGAFVGGSIKAISALNSIGTP